MELVKGMKEYTGEEAEKRQRLKGILAETFKKYGFELAETPILEYEEFVKGENNSDEAISDIFKLKDKGKRNLALRYEFTFQLKRLMKNRKLPYKRFQIGEVFRDEPTSSARFRQFTQCDVEVIGSTIKDEAEILALAKNIFEKLGVKAEININSRKLLNEILEKEGIRNKEAAIREIDKLDKLPEKDVRQNLKKYDAEKILMIFKKPEKYFKKYESYNEIEELKKYCSFYDVKVKFQPSLARGLGYYAGNIFEIKAAEMKETIAAGGSYIVNGIQATGISLGVERISSLIKIKQQNKKVLVVSIAQDKKAIELARKLRKNDIPVIIMYKITNALEYANSLGMPYSIFVGEKEVKAGKFKLRDMKSGKEKMLSEDKLIKELKD